VGLDKNLIARGPICTGNNYFLYKVLSELSVQLYPPTYSSEVAQDSHYYWGMITHSFGDSISDNGLGKLKLDY
jgi:hypothetical protein